jgi:hypothetical protein
LSVKPEVVNVRIMQDRPDIKRTLIALTVAVGVLAGLVMVNRKLSGPDSLTFVRMRMLAEVQEIADGQARFWHEVSAKAGDLYLASRS